MPAKKPDYELDKDLKIRLGIRSIGSIETKMVKCGKKPCRCIDGKLHGPYRYHQYREVIGGAYRKVRKYLKPDDVEGTRIALLATKSAERARKEYERNLMAFARKIPKF